MLFYVAVNREGYIRQALKSIFDVFCLLDDQILLSS